jgi:hypothetical protein
MLKSNYQQSRLYLSIAIFLGLAALIEPIVIIGLLQKADEEKVIIMDAGGNFHLVKSKPFSKTRSLQVECAKFAVKSLFDKSASGVDDPIGLEQVYLMKFCGDQIKELLKKEQTEFEKKHINQDSEIGAINIINQKKDYYLANISGQLVRTCNYMEHSYVDVKLFKFSVLLYKNPNISQNGKLPLCVYKIISYETKDKN